jgi:hypothetical protein
MSRQVFLLGLGIGVLGLGFAVTNWALGLQPGVTEANVKRVRPGMRLEEVESVLGPREGRPEEALRIFTVVNQPLPGAEYTACVWGGSGVAVVIVFDSGRRATQIHCRQGDRQNPLAILWAWLGWRTP